MKLNYGEWSDPALLQLLCGSFRNQQARCSRSFDKRGSRISEYSTQDKETVLILCRRQWFDEVGCSKEEKVDAVSSSKDDEF